MNIRKLIADRLPLIEKTKKYIGHSQQGQVIIVLLMTTLVVLTVGFAITMRSLGNLTTSTRSDQSQRAFSAAEAGIETYLYSPASTTGMQAPISLPNNTTVDVYANVDAPKDATEALEYPPIGKETIAQFWLVDPRINNPTPIKAYNGTNFEIYFGNQGENLSSATTPAVEVTVITYESATSSYGTKKFYLDPYRTRGILNHFTTTDDTALVCTIGSTVNTPSTTSIQSNFACKYTLSLGSCNGSCFPVITRVRLLYSTVNQKVAIKGTGGNSLPKQAQIYYARGNSGQSQQILKVFKMPSVVPAFLDFAIFSLGSISK